MAFLLAFSSIATLVSAEEQATDASATTAAYGTPEAIDGILDAGWQNANTYVADKTIGAPTNSMNWKIMYDDTNLYIYADVTDSTVGTAEQEKPGNADALWAKNTVQVYLDLGYERTVGTFDANDIQIDVNARGYYFTKYFKAMSYVNKAAVVTETGYTVEIALDLGVYPEFDNKAGTNIGFDIWAADSNASFNGREGLVSWVGVEKVYYDPSSMGTVTLGAKPATTPGYDGIIKGERLQTLGAIVTPIANATGSHMSNIGAIINGTRTDSIDTWGCTYTDDLGVWFGLQFEKEYEISQVVFWEGGHWADGGWFGSSPVLQCYVGDEWIDVDFTLTPTYPGDSQAEQGLINEPWFFDLEEPVVCSKVRVLGDKTSLSGGHASISELEAYGNIYEEAAEPDNPTAVYGTPTDIDGTLDAGWENAYDYTADKKFGSPTNSLNWKVMYDDTYLYFFAEVTDSTVGTAEQEGNVNDDALWARNTVQVYLDLGYERTVGSFDFNDIQIDVNARGYYYTKYYEASRYVKKAATVTPTGYNVEIAIDLGLYPEFDNKAGTNIGFDIWAADSVDFSGRAGFVNYTGYDTTYNNPSLMATLVLGEKPETTPGYDGLIKGDRLQTIGATLTPIANSTGDHMANIGNMVDGNRNNSIDTWRCTYTDDLGVWFGAEFEQKYDITQVIFWEGGHWSNGGWFGSSPRLQCFVEGEWVDVDHTLSPAYPGDSQAEQGWAYEPWFFTLENAVTCSKVRVIGQLPSCDDSQTSVAEIEVYGYAAGDAPDFEPEQGDINCDGVVANSDIAIVIRYLSGFATDLDTASFDMNADGKINNRDAIELIRIVAGLD